MGRKIAAGMVAQEVFGILNEPFYNEPGFLIRRAHQKAVALFLEMTADIGITPVQYAALLAIAAHPDVDQQRVAVMIAVDRTTINEVTKRLAEKGLVVRGSGRGRHVHLRCTMAGTKLIERARKALREHGERMLAPLSVEERAGFVRALRLVARDE